MLKELFWKKCEWMESSLCVCNVAFPLPHDNSDQNNYFSSLCNFWNNIMRFFYYVVTLIQFSDSIIIIFVLIVVLKPNSPTLPFVNV